MSETITLERTLLPLKNKEFNKIIAFNISGSKIDLLPEELIQKTPNRIEGFPNCTDIILERDILLHSLVAKEASFLGNITDGLVDKDTYSAGANIMYKILLNEANEKKISMPFYEIDKKTHSNNPLASSKNKQTIDNLFILRIKEIIAKPEYKYLAPHLEEELHKFAFEAPEIYHGFFNYSENNNGQYKNNLSINPALLLGATKIYNIFRKQLFS